MLQLIFAWMLADFASGFFHWIEDRYLKEEWPIIGEYVAKPNLLHHAQPMAFLEGTYWHRNYTTIIPALLLAALALWIGAAWWVVVAALFLTQANEIHALGHQQGKVAWWVALPQETGVLQSPRHHALHHKSPYEVRYCVMSNWLNPWLDAFGFWWGLEWMLSFAGIKTRDSV